MDKSERTNGKQESVLPETDIVLVGSIDMPNGISIAKEILLGEKIIQILGLSRIGESYSGNKKTTDDGSVAIKREDSLSAIVVDGGTQVDKLPSLDQLGITGATYIRQKVEEHGQRIDPQVSAGANLFRLNAKIGEDTTIEHPDVEYSEHSHSVPYGSICAVKIDVKRNTLEAANAGDAFVIVVRDGKPELLSVDDVYEKDQQTFETTRRLAQEFGVTFRHAMQNRTRDPRFRKIVDETFETMRLGNTGEIRRITGAPNFDLTTNTIVSLEGIQNVFLFTDGAIPGGVDIHTEEGLQEWFGIVSERGIEGLNDEIKSRASLDPDWQKYPRFGNLDDLMIIQISLGNNAA